MTGGRWQSVACCVSCWNQQHPDRAVSEDRLYNRAAEDTCHYCEQPTRHGIYVREWVYFTEWENAQ